MHIETTPRRQHSISLTPLIDVVFILLVFFMLATSFADWRPIQLATGTSEASPNEQPPAVVSVAEDGALSYRGARYNATSTLAQRLRQALDAGEISAVIVEPVGDAPLSATVGALDALSGAGVAPMTLATGASAADDAAANP